MNFYDYLGISPTATEEEIKRAFRTQAKQTHPDYNKDPNSFFQMVELNLIRDTLLDHSKRAAYDMSST